MLTPVLLCDNVPDWFDIQSMYELFNDRVERCDELPTPGHPLYERGLERLAASEVFESSWIKAQKKIDSVSQNHSNANFDMCRHYFIGFHESSFECIAINTTVKIHYGDIDFTDLVELLNES